MSNTFPPLRKLFVGRYLELPNVMSDVFYETPVPASQIIAIWQPGDPEYDAFPDLPGGMD